MLGGLRTFVGGEGVDCWEGGVEGCFSHDGCCWFGLNEVLGCIYRCGVEMCGLLI